MSSFVLLTKHFLRLQSINSNYKVNNLYKLMNKTRVFSPINTIIGKRYLFSNEILGIDKYIETKHKIEAQFADMKDKFLERMNDYTDSETNMIFTEDLKNVIFLVDNNDTHLDLLIKMLKKFHSQNQSLRFGTFIFGPIVMRLIHNLGDSDLAIKLFKDPQFKGFFSQLSSLTIALDLLYKQQKYEEVIDLFNYTQNNALLETKYPRDCILLLIASCYKLNTPQSFETALETMRGAQEVDAKVTRKTVCLFAALALNQNQPNIALEILSIAGNTNYVTVKNLRLAALTDIGRLDDVFTILKVMLNRDNPQEYRGAVLEETLNKIKSAVNSANDKELSNTFSQIERGLNEGNHIQTVSLDSLLTAPVRPLPEYKVRQQQNFGFRQERPIPGRQNDRNFKREASNARLGLKDSDME